MTEIKTHRLILISRVILTISGLANLVNFVINIPVLDIRMLLFGIALIVISYIITKLSYLTNVVMLSAFIGAGACIYYVGTQTVDFMILFQCVGPIIAAAIGFLARRKIPSLMERDKISLRELRLTLRLLKRNRTTMIAIGIILFFYAVAVLQPYLLPYDPLEINSKELLLGISSQHILGTDHLGRDVLSRLIMGTRISMSVGIITVVITFSMGTTVGGIAGYFGGKSDEVLMRVTDIIMAFPGITLIMIVAYLLGRGILSAIIAISIVGWTGTARLLRSTVIVEKEKEYVIAARALGKSDIRILFGEILPNSIHPLIITATMRLGGAIISVAGLSFIGLGIQPPYPDWGIMISEGRKFIFFQPTYAIMPGILIILVVLSFNILGDALRDALDPTLRRQM